MRDASRPLVAQIAVEQVAGKIALHRDLRFRVGELASEATGPVTKAGLPIGTMLYISPEQVGGQAVDSPGSTG